MEHVLKKSFCFFVVAGLMTSVLASAQTAGETPKPIAVIASPEIVDKLEKIAADHEGVMGIYCRHLGSGEIYQVNSDVPFPSASTIKVAVMCTALDLLARGEGPFESYYDTKKYDSSTSTGGSGLIRHFKNGAPVELKEMIHLMITISDNIATNMICDWMGLEEVNEWLSRAGFKETRMFSTVGGGKVYDSEGRETWGLGRTTPREMANLMASIASGRAGTTSTTDEMLRVLGNQYFDASIPAVIPPTVYVGSKSGALNRSRSDAAIVAGPTGTYVLAVFTKDNKDTSWKNDNKAEAAIAEVSSVVWRHFNPESEWTQPKGADQF